MEDFILDQSVGYTLNIVANLLKRELNDEFQREGIDVLAEQWALLYRLHERGGMNQQELAASLSRDNGSVTRTVLVLESKQLLERRQVDTDRRHRYLYLTPAGQALIPRLIACAKRGLQRATDGLTPQEVTQLNHLVLKMTRNLSR
jgi:DNA-binding MarR family transcriptional regulator